MKFKIGDVVICVDNEGSFFPLDLTIGKRYTVVPNSTYCNWHEYCGFSVISDNGEVQWFHYDCFITLKKMRKNKLKKLKFYESFM